MIVHCPKCRADFEADSVWVVHECKTGNVIPNPRTIETLRAALAVASLEHGSMRALGEAIGVPTSTVHAWIIGDRKPGKLAQRTLWQELDRLGVTGRWTQAK